MAKKIKLSDIKVKSFNILDKKERQTTKGGYYHPKEVRDTRLANTTWSANTIVDIRDPFNGSGGNDKKGKLSDLNGLTP